MNTYKRLCKNLVIRRNEKSSINLEEKMKRDNAIHCDRGTRLYYAEDEEEEESDYESMREKELRRRSEDVCGKLFIA